MAIGKGNKRICFQHPGNKSLCVKVAHRKDGWKENIIEWLYIKSLNLKSIDTSHLAMCHGWTSTNFGHGLVFDRVVNFDGTNALTLKDFLKNDVLNVDQEKIAELVSSLKLWALKNGVAVIEPNEVNIMVRDTGGILELVLVDGVGGRERFSVKNLMYVFSKKYSNRKTKKQFLAFEKKLINFK
ncbi:PhoP regulatory network protein YrbL [Halomonas sp. hl-4]|nr:PhoP regulatory network protein YrbL [Halomonas sp. hl-4]